MLVYVDDVLYIYEEPDSVHGVLNKYFLLKSDSVGTPNIYLSAKFNLIQLKNDVWAWVSVPASMQGRQSRITIILYLSIYLHNTSYQRWHPIHSPPSTNQELMSVLNSTPIWHHNSNHALDGWVRLHRHSNGSIFTIIARSTTKWRPHGYCLAHHDLPWFASQLMPTYGLDLSSHRWWTVPNDRLEGVPWQCHRTHSTKCPKALCRQQSHRGQADQTIQ